MLIFQIISVRKAQLHILSPGNGIMGKTSDYILSWKPFPLCSLGRKCPPFQSCVIPTDYISTDKGHWSSSTWKVLLCLLLTALRKDIIKPQLYIWWILSKTCYSLPSSSYVGQNVHNDRVGVILTVRVPKVRRGLNEMTYLNSNFQHFIPDKGWQYILTKLAQDRWKGKSKGQTFHC